MCTNLRKMQINAVSDFAPRYVQIPCGKCEQCRQSQKSAWSFRLCSELEECSKNGWSIGFFTLTYNDENLPYIPCDLFADSEKISPIPCFNKRMVRDFILNLRKKLKNDFNIIGVKYMVCAELGETTKRPHYHGIIAWPRLDSKVFPEASMNGKRYVVRPCADLTPEVLHSFIRDFWPFGFISPRYPDGSGSDDKRPFEVLDNGLKCAKYASKYCCKDLGFTRSLLGSSVDIHSKDFRNYDCFHIQSRSLGLGVLRGATNAKKLQLLLNGYCFNGESTYTPIPVYIKNKIVFDIHYIVDDEGHRLVRRSANQFFLENYEAIFSKKRSFYSEFFRSLTTPDFFTSRGVSSELALKLCMDNRSVIDRYFSCFDSVADFYIAWYGVPLATSFAISPARQWLLRYSNRCNVYRCELNDYDEIIFKSQAIDCLFSSLEFCDFSSSENEKREIDKLSDFVKNGV